MTKEDLLKIVSDYLDNNFSDPNKCCELHLIEWVNAVMDFRTKTVQKCCTKTLMGLKHLVLDESTNSDYVVRKGAMFGDLNEIRREGFERRYLFNVSKTKTYIEAYKKTEDEYIATFGKRRYSSYDSFRNVRNRYVNKK
jgi:hypothetical protein